MRMDISFVNNKSLQVVRVKKELEKCNQVSERFGLSLSEQQMEWLMQNRYESLEQLTDDELLCAMRSIFDHSGGSLEHLRSIDRETLYRIACSGTVDGTYLEQEAEECDAGHLIEVETVDNEYHISLSHPMEKNHYISFVAFITSSNVEVVKLYPEQDISLRFRKKGHGYIYVFCNRHGLFQTII